MDISDDNVGIISQEGKVPGSNPGCWILIYLQPELNGLENSKPVIAWIQSGNKITEYFSK